MPHRHTRVSTQSKPPPSRWMVLVASIWIQAFSANPYNFYSPTLKTVLSINQFELNLLAFTKDFGEHAGILPGILCNKLPPWALLSIGALCAFVGYGSIWLVAGQQISYLPYLMMLIAICIGPNSATWFNTVALVTCMRNFPDNRGLIAGFLKGFVGLSSSIYTLIFTSYLSKDPLKLLLFLAIGPAVVSLILMSFVRPIKSEEMRDEEEEQSNFIFVYILCILLAVYLLIATIVEEQVAFPTRLVPDVIAGVMLLFLIVPAFVPFRYYIEWSFSRQRELARAQSDSAKQLLLSHESVSRRRRRGREALIRPRLSDIDEGDEEAFFLALAEGAVTTKKGPRRGEDFNLKQALVKADFWLLFLAFFCGVGPGIVTNDNLAQIGEAYGTTDVTTCVALLGIFNFLGRLGGGFVSEYYVRMTAIDRPVGMALGQALNVVANLLFAFGRQSFLMPASAIMGFCFGVQVSVMIPTASELFGLKHFGVIYNFINMSIPLSSLLFSALLAGHLYDQEAEPGNHVCYGMQCFQLTFVTLAAVCVLGLLVSLILSYRIRPVYKTLYPSAMHDDIVPQSDVSSSALLPEDVISSSLEELQTS